MIPQLLAQIPGIEPPEPPPLPAPPWLAHHLLESPWLLIAILVAAGLTAFVFFNARANAKAGLKASAACLALAAAIGVLAALIETPREQAAAFTRKLVSDATAGRVPAVDSELSPAVLLFYSGAPEGGQAKEWILNRISSAFGPTGSTPVADAAILEIQPYIDGPATALVQLKVRVTLAALGYPTISWWRLELEHSGGIWKARAIRCLSANVPVG